MFRLFLHLSKLHTRPIAEVARVWEALQRRPEALQLGTPKNFQNQPIDCHQQTSAFPNNSPIKICRKPGNSILLPLLSVIP
jgi:hypothetical protein